MRSIFMAVRRSWCRAMHPAPMWPVKGFYTCPRCQYRYPVPWESADPVVVEEHPADELRDAAAASNIKPVA